MAMQYYYDHYMCISTHILAKRMTKAERIPYALVLISTHILTKRMTTHCGIIFTLTEHFNSHPHEEDDKASA